MGLATMILLSAISVYWATGFVNSAAVSQPTTPQKRKTLLRVPASVRIPDFYFVNVRQSVSESEIYQLVEDLRAHDANDSMPDFSAQVMFVITKIGYGFSAKLSAEALDYVQTIDIVSYLEEDEVFEAGEGESNFRSVRAIPSVPWGLDKLDSDFSDGLYHPPCNLTGTGVDVYVLDSGIEYTNAYFEGRALYPGCDVVDEVEGERRQGADCSGHGTSVATVIGGSHLGVARNVSLFSMRVLSCNKSGSSTNVMKGLECMIEHHSQRDGRPAVVNLSLFGRKSKLLKRAIDKVMGFGVTVVASSGNVGQGTSTSRVRDACRVSPGSIHGVITVAGSTRDNLAYDVTKMGSCVDILAPGKDIFTATIGLGNFCPYCSTVLSGSSFAAPHVTGAIALLLEKCPNLTPWRVKHILLTRMTKANLLNMNVIHRRYRGVTPNLSLRLDSSICSMEC